MCGIEFELEHIGKMALICRTYYSGKYSEVDFWNPLKICMTDIGFISCKSYPEICKCPAQNNDGIIY